jgi:hypothetical protein
VLLQTSKISSAVLPRHASFGEGDSTEDTIYEKYMSNIFCLFEIAGGSGEGGESAKREMGQIIADLAHSPPLAVEGD